MLPSRQSVVCVHAVKVSRPYAGIDTAMSARPLPTASPPTASAMGARRQKTDLHVAEPTILRSCSPASLRSQRAKQYRASLPVRTARLLQRSRAQTPSDAGLSDGTVSPAPAPACLLQDVVDIKTLLLQLKRVLQEPGEEHHSMSSETLDPLLNMCVESPARINGRKPTPVSPLHPDACADLRRQILFLQSQLEERDRLVKVLQQQMLRMSGTHPDTRVDDTCNVATQTDRLRPPMSTTLANSENSGLVSWNEQVNGRKLPTYNEAQKSKRAVTNGTALKCTCGARKQNGLTNGDLENGHYDPRNSESVHLRTNSRVGSRYLQALANNADKHVKRDTSANERTIKKTYMYSSRSRSIENFQNNNYTVSNETNGKKGNAILDENSQVKHHTSYGDLYNGRINSRESVCGNRLSPTQNGQSTDTDYSSDGGYKSLPSTINCSVSPKKVSGIPRRSLEQKFLSSKHNVKASAV